MTAIPIVCDNCGAKYKLPETFSGPHAKCQKCGSAIDVARQRIAASGAADAAPAAARPAGARPALDRSKEAPRAAERAPAISPPRNAARDERGRGATDGGRRRSRAGARDSKPGKSKLPWIVAAVVVVVGVVAFVATR